MYHINIYCAYKNHKHVPIKINKVNIPCVKTFKRKLSWYESWCWSSMHRVSKILIKWTKFQVQNVMLWLNVKSGYINKLLFTNMSWNSLRPMASTCWSVHIRVFQNPSLSKQGSQKYRCSVLLPKRFYSWRLKTPSQRSDQEACFEPREETNILIWTWIYCRF